MAPGSKSANSKVGRAAKVIESGVERRGEGSGGERRGEWRGEERGEEV